MPGPLVLMARVRGAVGWQVRVSDREEVELAGLGLEVFGAQVVREDWQLVLRSQDPRVRLEPHANAPASSVHAGWVHASGGVLEVVLFRAGDVPPRGPPSARVLDAIHAVRANDTEATRQVLCDVLEEAGAPAEAEYVRLELTLQQQGDLEGPTFLEGVQRLRALSQVVGPTFRYLVGRDIDGCAGVRWSFRCPKSWNDMVETGRDRERLCVTCRQVVVQVTDEVSAVQLAQSGVCASVRVGVDDWEGELAEEPVDGPSR
jgi:uncharacterized protein (TIGR02996 family)